MDQENSERGVSFMEKHFQTIVMSALAAVCGWMALTTQNLTVSVATLTEKVSNLQEQIGKQSENTYGEQIAELRARVTVLEADQKRPTR